MNLAERVRSVLCDELIMLGHVVTEQEAAALDVDGTHVVVIYQSDGSVGFVFAGNEYRVMPTEVNWPLLTSAVAAVATRDRKKERNA